MDQDPREVAAALAARIFGYAFTASAGLLLLQWLRMPAAWRERDGEVNHDPTMVWREDGGKSTLEPRHAPRPEGAPPLPRVTLEEVARHATADDLWVCIDERAYDLTEFVRRHPGGLGPVMHMAGTDCSDAFANYHAARVYRTMLPSLLVGEVVGVERVPHVQDFRAARQEMLRRGLFETDYRFYGLHACWLASLFTGALHLTLGDDDDAGSSSSAGRRLAGAALMGVFWQQLAGLGHDLGHSGVTHHFHLDHAIGSALALFMGLSVCWWKADHNTHHVACNAVEHDPNIQHMPLLAVTPKIFGRPRFWDTYHRRWVGMDAAARFLVSRQHLFFYPVMAFARLNLYVQGLVFLLAGPGVAAARRRHARAELACLAGFAAWCTAVVASMPSWRDALAWVLVSHAVAGVLHVQIVLSHWSRHCYTGRAYAGKDDEWHITQLRTTMNVDTPPWLDWAHLGLQFQIEHHLFPRLPRHNLRRAREMVRAVVATHFPAGDERFPSGRAYHEPGFVAGNLEMWRQLRRTATAARRSKRDGATGFYQSALWDGLRATG